MEKINIDGVFTHTQNKGKLSLTTTKKAIFTPG
jgi:hypothetical protein